MEYLGSMSCTNRILALLGAALLSSAVVQAVPATNLKENYQSIIERNPFGLQPPKPAQAEKPAEKEKPKTEIFLTGITSVGFPKLPKQVYFYTREQGKKDPVFYALSEGDSKDGIKILNIDPQQRKVRVNMNNSDTVLSFETHGVPVPAAAARPGMPGTLPVPGQPGQPQPGVQPLPMPTPTGRAMYDANGQPTYQNAAQPVQTAVNTGYQNAANPPLRQIPSRRIRGGAAPNDAMINPGAGATAQPQQQEQAPDLAEQYLRMHLDRAAKERQGIPMPPLPTIQ
jgi:hypothetical protein